MRQTVSGSAMASRVCQKPTAILYMSRACCHSASIHHAALQALSSLLYVYVHCIQGSVVAFDKTSPKVAKLHENVERFGLSCVQCFVFDATKALCDDGSTAREYPDEVVALEYGHCTHTELYCSQFYWQLKGTWNLHDSMKQVSYTLVTGVYGPILPVVLSNFAGCQNFTLLLAVCTCVT